MKNNFAYATLVVGDDYFWGAACLAFSLKESKNIYPLIIMMANCSEKIIEQSKILTTKCNVIVKQIQYYKFSEENNPYESTINKLQILDFTEYDKIVFLDADTVVIDCIDNVFNNLNKYCFFQAYDPKIKDVPVKFWGGFFLLSPGMETFNNIYLKYKDKCSEDESLLLDWFGYDDLEEYSMLETKYVYHLKYWKIYNLYDLKTCELFIKSKLYNMANVSHIQQRGFK